jgi:hypothetical protein
MRVPFPGAFQWRSRITYRPAAWSLWTKATTARRYVAPRYCGFTEDSPSQHASFSGTRTTLIRQDFIAAIAAASVGPSFRPHPCAHAYSKLERLTPRRRIVCPLPLTKWLPLTLIESAAL